MKKPLTELITLSSGAITDLNNNAIVGDLSDTFLLMFKTAACDACGRMHAAFLQIYPPVFVVVAALESESALVEAVKKYQVAELPTLIYYLRGKEYKRWGGFFDCNLPAAAVKLKFILQETYNSSGVPLD